MINIGMIIIIVAAGTYAPLQPSVVQVSQNPLVSLGVKQTICTPNMLGTHVREIWPLSDE